MSESNEKDSKNNEDINNEEKKIISDLDYLSEDLPRKKIKKKNKNELIIPEINFDQLITLKNIEEESTLIKPSNFILNISNNNKSKLQLFNNNKNLFNRIRNNHNLFNNKKIQNRKQKSTFLDNFNYNVSNLVQPINHRKNFSMNEKEDYISLGIENLKKKMTTLQKKSPTYSNNKNKRNQSFKYNYEPITNTDDYFFSLFKDFSSQNKSLHNLDKKVYKVSHKDLDDENNEGKNEKNRKNYKSEEKKYEFDPKKNFLENIGIAQYNITNATKKYEKQMKENNSKNTDELKEKKRKNYREKRHSVVIDNRLMQLFKMNHDLNEIDIIDTKNEEKKENKKSEENSESDNENKK